MLDIENQTKERFPVDVELANHDDLFRARAGFIQSVQVRRIGLRAVVADRTMRLIIPEPIAKHLGLETTGNTKVRYVDGRTEERSMVKGISLSYGGRAGVFSAIVEPDAESVSIGRIVLVDLDLLVNREEQQRLVPREPKQIVCEL